MKLSQILSTHFNWNKARISFLSNLIIALLKVRTVCLTDLATALLGKAKTESKYKQLQRFLRDFEMDIDSVSTIIGAIVPVLVHRELDNAFV